MARGGIIGEVTFDLVSNDFASGRKNGKNIPGCRNSMSKDMEAEKGRHVYGPVNVF